MAFNKKPYSAYEKIESRRLKPEVAFGFLLLFGFIIGLGYVVYDLSKSPSTIDDSENVAIVGQVKAERDNYQLITTDDYSVRIPEDWVNVNNPERIYEEGLRYYPDRYQGTTRESKGRYIEIFINDIPNVPLDSILEVTPDGDSVNVGQFSPPCYDFVEYDEDSGAASTDIPTEWNDREFLCRRTTTGNRIGSVVNDTKSGFLLNGSDEDTRFLVVFADTGANEDNSIFKSIMETFKAI